MSQETTNYPINKEQLSGQHGGSREFGPLLLIYNLDLTQEKITVTAKLTGVTIGIRVIELNNPYPVEIAGSTGISRAEIELTVNASNKTLNYNISVENFGSRVFKGSGVLLDW
ncbi:hypothetical protein [uncultured Tenacibaculum sp.]|uniref:hypothetical protein n=1 Tax=uncultured Tenacibaculum sp. TaxID=174713 RepID=UPI002601C2F7|nr:hypothetical protein [uncultured Tenacibaculum sp.]